MAALGLLCLGLLIWVIVNAVLVAQDRARFAEVSQEKSLIASRLADSLGNNVISTREQDECFNAEQGPWDNGNLWCQVATVLSLQHEIDFQETGKTYLAIGDAVSLKGDSASGMFPEYWIEIGRSMKCQLEYKYADDRQEGGAMSIPFSGKERTALAITCADRARASYYPYSN